MQLRLPAPCRHHHRVGAGGVHHGFPVRAEAQHRDPHSPPRPDPACARHSHRAGLILACASCTPSRNGICARLCRHCVPAVQPQRQRCCHGTMPTSLVCRPSRTCWGDPAGEAPFIGLVHLTKGDEGCLGHSTLAAWVQM